MAARDARKGRPTGLVESLTSHHPLKPPVDDGVPRVVPSKRKYTKEELRGDVQYLSQRVMTWLLEGDRLERMLEDSKLKDVAIVMGITTEKLLLLEGQPTQIVSQQQQQTLDTALPLLLQEMKRRGVQTEIRERTVTMTAPSEPAG